MANIFWTGYSNEPRAIAISQLQSVIARYGDLIEFKFFSDISLSLVIDMMEPKLDELYSELGELIQLDAIESHRFVSDREVTLFLNVTFTKGTGSLIQEVPAVPG